MPSTDSVAADVDETMEGDEPPAPKERDKRIQSCKLPKSSRSTVPSTAPEAGSTHIGVSTTATGATTSGTGRDKMRRARSMNDRGDEVDDDNDDDGVDNDDNDDVDDNYDDGDDDNDDDNDDDDEDDERLMNTSKPTVENAHGKMSLWPVVKWL